MVLFALLAPVPPLATEIGKEILAALAAADAALLEAAVAELEALLA